MVLNDRKDERMALNKKGGLGKGLGKGIDSLISNAYAVETKKKDSAADKKEPETTVKLRLVEPASSQPRLKFDEDTLTELAESIKKYGVIQPIVVKKVEDHYQIIAGERRWRAAKQAGLKDIPVIIKDYDEQQIAEIALIENLQREDLNPIEEAKAYKQLIDEFSLKQDEVADKVSKSRTAITNALRLLKLDERVQNMVIEECISSGHARTLLAIENKEEQYDIACMVFDQKLSVRETEKLIKKLNNKETPKKKIELDNKDIYADFEEKLKQSMGTKVSINRKSNTKGKIEIEYYSETELERIIGMMLENS